MIDLSLWNANDGIPKAKINPINCFGNPKRVKEISLKKSPIINKPQGR